MKRFTTSIQTALNNTDWYGALSTSLTMPDICAKLENPNEKGVGKRYRKWVKDWLIHHYEVQIGDGNPTVFMTPSDLYGLRCSYLHEGGYKLEKNAHNSLSKFEFITPPSWGMLHRIKMNDILYLQVDIFCQEMIAAVDAWALLHKENHEVNRNMNNLLVIKNSDSNIPGLIKYD